MTELMSGLGFRGYCFDSLSEAQAMTALGQGMAATTLAVALLPLVKALRVTAAII